MHPIIKLSREPAELLSTSTNIELIVLGHPLLYTGVCRADINIHPSSFFNYVILFHVIIWKVIVNMMSFNPCLRYSYDFKFNI